MAEKRSLAFAFLGEDRSLGKTLKNVARDSDTAHSSLSRLGKVAIGAGAIAGVTLLSKKVIDFGRDTVDAYTGAAKSAGALQRVMGGSVEDASRLGFAAHEAGVEQDSFSKSLRLLEKNLGNATKAQVVKTKSSHQEIVMVDRLSKGHLVHVKALKTFTDVTSRTVKVSKDLGFQYQDVHGKLLPMRDILLNVADKFQHMPNGVAKTTMALKLFGKAGTDMIPLLNKGRDGVSELMKESDKLGTTMSSKDVAGVKAYTEEQRHLSAAMEGLKITIGRELFPIFTAWSDSLAKNAPKIIAWVKDHLPGFRREAQKVASFITDDLEPAVANFTSGLVEEGTQIEKTVAPFFHWLGDHPDLLKQIGKDALILGGALKAKSLLTALGLLKGSGGASLGGIGGGLASGGKPGVTPVYVTNWGGKVNDATVVKNDSKKLAGLLPDLKLLGTGAIASYGLSKAVGGAFDLTDAVTADAKKRDQKYALSKATASQKSLILYVNSQADRKNVPQLHTAADALKYQAAITAALPRDKDGHVGLNANAAAGFLKSYGDKTPADAAAIRSLQKQATQDAHAAAAQAHQDARQAAALQALLLGQGGKPMATYNDFRGSIFQGITDPKAFAAAMAKNNRVQALAGGSGHAMNSRGIT